MVFILCNRILYIQKLISRKFALVVQLDYFEVYNKILGENV